MKYLKTFIFGILAGICICFGGITFLFCKVNNQPILGGILFSIGLLLICSFGFFLYTGKIGYVFANKKSFLIDLLIGYVGNVVGTLAVGSLFKLCNVGGEAMRTVIDSVSNSKLLDLGNGVGKSWYSLIILGFFCGMLVFIAVDLWKRESVPHVLKIVGLFAAISAFVIAGFEHCVANMFYFAFSGAFFSSSCGSAILSILLVTIGNSLGSIALYSCIYLIKA